MTMSGCISRSARINCDAMRSPETSATVMKTRLGMERALQTRQLQRRWSGVSRTRAIQDLVQLLDVLRITDLFGQFRREALAVVHSVAMSRRAVPCGL